MGQIYIPEDEVLSIRCAPSFWTAGFAPRPLPKDNGLAFVVGGGAAMAAQGSLSSKAALDFAVRGLEADFGGGAAIVSQRSSSFCEDAGLTFSDFAAVFGSGAEIEPHKSSSSAFDVFKVVLGFAEVVAAKK